MQRSGGDGRGGGGVPSPDLLPPPAGTSICSFVARICFRRPPGPRAAPLPGRGELGLLPPHDKPVTLPASSALASFLLCSGSASSLSSFLLCSGSASSLCSSLLPRLLWFSSSPREHLENAWASLGTKSARRKVTG